MPSNAKPGDALADALQRFTKNDFRSAFFMLVGVVNETCEDSDKTAKTIRQMAEVYGAHHGN